jgi:uncharacterized protein (DUF1501 family)
MTSRRKFIKQSALAAAGSLAVPSFLKSIEARGASSFLNADSGKVLVVIQLSGGNDGLNTVVPFKNDIYYKSRPKIAIPADEVLEISKDAGFHPQLKIFKEFYDQGILSVMSNVGYQNAERTHMAAMEAWQTARSGKENIHKTGWIGRYLDENCPPCKKNYMAIQIDDTVSLALRGEKVKGIAVSDPERSYKNFSSDYFREVASIKDSAPEESSLHFLYQTMEDTMSSIDYIYEKSKVFKTKTAYPLTQFGVDLKTVAELIISNIETKVFYVTLPGFDTHVDQLPKHEKILGKYADGIKSFVKDLKVNNRLNDVMIMTFSEFGRRLDENQSEGTDHGLANNLFLISGGLKKPGLYNAIPNLLELDQGGLRPTVDFKNIYATLLKKWLNADDNEILGKQYSYLNF